MGWDCLALQADSLPSEPARKLKNTGVGSLSLVQRNFLTQESNWGLLHCRQILYQLSYQGSPLMVWQMACNLVEGRAAPLAALERQSEIMIDVFTGCIYYQVSCVLAG